jgi:hypothetical protein
VTVNLLIGRIADSPYASSDLGDLGVVATDFAGDRHSVTEGHLPATAGTIYVW